MAMSSKAEQYRCYGEKALASAKQATCEEEKAELLEIAEAWFKLAVEQNGRLATRNQRQRQRQMNARTRPNLGLGLRHTV